MTEGTAAEHTSAAPAPVWAPNPAVPISARILAYLFGGLTLLTAILGLYIARPPDVPPLPNHWATYHTPQGCTLPYPSGWTMRVQPVKGAGDWMIFALMPESPVGVEACTIKLQVQADSLPSGKIEEMWEPDLRKRFKGYTRRDDGTVSVSAEDAKSFTFLFDDNGDAIKMAGASMVRTSGATVLLLVAYAPEEGWVTMKQIADHMLTDAKFD